MLLMHGDGKLVPFHVPESSRVRGLHGDGMGTSRGRFSDLFEIGLIKNWKLKIIKRNFLLY